jgi:hypothetical protein
MSAVQQHQSSIVSPEEVASAMNAAFAEFLAVEPAAAAAALLIHHQQNMNPTVQSFNDFLTNTNTHTSNDLTRNGRPPTPYAVTTHTYSDSSSASSSTSSTSSSSSSTSNTSLPRYKTLLDKSLNTSDLDLSQSQSTTAASIVSNSNALIRNYYENFCHNAPSSSSTNSSTTTTNRKKRSISNEYDFPSNTSTEPKRFRATQTSAGWRILLNNKKTTNSRFCFLF